MYHKRKRNRQTVWYRLPAYKHYICHVLENISMNRLIHLTKRCKIDILIPLKETRTEHLITLLASLTRLINL